MKKGAESISQVDLMMRMLSSMQKMMKRGKGNREEIGEVEAVKAAGLDGGVSSIGFG